MHVAGRVSYNPAVWKLQRQERDQLPHISQLQANMGHPSVRRLLIHVLIAVLIALLAGAVWAQEAPSGSGGTVGGTSGGAAGGAAAGGGQPKIQVNFLN